MHTPFPMRFAASEFIIRDIPKNISLVPASVSAAAARLLVPGRMGVKDLWPFFALCLIRAA